MKFPTPMVDYREFRFSRIHEPQYRHLWWLLFFPAYWLRYPLIENLNPASTYRPIYCALDDRIPFCEWFYIPYMLWTVSMLAFCLYTLLYDVDAFKWYMKFLTVSMSISTVIFLIYPSCQNLRPTEFPRDNILTKAVAFLYRADTNTNVFPSEHVIGAIAVWLGSLRCKTLRSPGKIAAGTAFMLLVSVSTVFLKQHSVLDVLAAIPVCLLSAMLCCTKQKI